MDADREILEQVGQHPITRFLSHAYRKACDHYAYARGPGLKALERVEEAYRKCHGHLMERFSFATICWWLSVATPADVQVELEAGFLSSEEDVRLVYGRGRRSLWEWAERDRAAWLATDFAREILARSGTPFVARECPLP